MPCSCVWPPGSPDLLAARQVADFLGTEHHEFTFTVQVRWWGAQGGVGHAPAGPRPDGFISGRQHLCCRCWGMWGVQSAAAAAAAAAGVLDGPAAEGVGSHKSLLGIRPGSARSSLMWPALLAWTALPKGFCPQEVVDLGWPCCLCQSCLVRYAGVCSVKALCSHCPSLCAQVCELDGAHAGRD